MSTTCPRDGSVLDAADHRTSLPRGCATCGGAWLAAADARALGWMRSTPGEPRSLALGTAEAIRCPEDGLPLVRSWVGEIEVQRCSGCHGLWLDLDALRAARSVTSDEPCADALGGELIADSAAGKRLLAKLWEWIGEWDDDGPDVD